MGLLSFFKRDISVDSVGDLTKEALQYHNAEQFCEAESLWLKIIKIKSDSAEIFKNYGNTLIALKQLDNAEIAYRKALELKPDYADALSNLGQILGMSGRFEEAEQALQKASTLLPDSAPIHSNLGIVLMTLGRLAESAHEFRKAILLDPNFFLGYLNLGRVLSETGSTACAEQALGTAIQLNPGSTEAYICLGILCDKSGRPTEAEQNFRKVIEINPEHFESYFLLGNLFYDRLLYAEAETNYLKSLEIQPDYSRAQFGLALLYMLQGNYSAGLKLYEFRFNHLSDLLNANNALQIVRNNVVGFDMWRGGSLEGATLTLITEQGSGDTIMMMRYLPLLKSKGLKKLNVYTTPELKRLIKAIPQVDEVRAEGTFFSPGLYCSMMSLPFCFGTRIHSIPDDVPYIVPPDDLRQKWRSCLSNGTGKKVGLVWAGGKYSGADHLRSIPLVQFEPLLNVKGAQLISLQKGAETRQLESLGWDIANEMDDCEDFLDTAALVSELDLIISVDTAVAHIAGALGKPVWLLNRYGSEWRWLIDREDSLWYPTMRIFRQQERGDWETVIQLISQDLARFVNE